jgi:hypothetical protein
MPDNWTFVAAAYGLAGLVFGAYWRRLARRERALRALSASRSALRVANTMRSREPSISGHPRPEPSSRPPLQQ